MKKKAISALSTTISSVVWGREVTLDSSKLPPIPKEEILIVGLLASQAQRIESEFKNWFSIRFSESKKGTNEKTFLHASKVDTVFLMSHFSSHKSLNEIGKSGTPIRYVSGTTTALRRELVRHHLERISKIHGISLESLLHHAKPEPNNALVAELVYAHG